MNTPRNMPAPWLQPAETKPADVESDSVKVPTTEPPAEEEPAPKLSRRWQFLNAFVDKTMPGLHPTQAAVWVHLHRHADHTGLVRRSQEQIAKGVNVSVPTVERAVRELKKLGLLHVLEKGYKLPDGTAKAAKYRIRAIIRQPVPAPDPSSVMDFT